MSCSIRRIIQIKEAIQYQNVVVWNNDVDISNQCQYSWSADGVCWTSWTTYSAYNRICASMEGDFYLRILLMDGFTGITLNGSFTTCYSICLDANSTFIQDFCGETNSFQPYNNLDCALQLQQQLSDSVVCIFGIPIYYQDLLPMGMST